MSDSEVNCDYFIDLTSYEKKTYFDFKLKIVSLRDNIIVQLENGLVTQTYNNYNTNSTVNQDDELKMLIEKNKDLRSSIDHKLEGISHQQTQYDTYKKDQKLLAQEIKETHEAFLLGKKYYKKFLKIYYTVEQKNGENQTIFVQFFTEAKKDSDNYSVRLQRNTKSGMYQLINTIPKLAATKNIQRRLQETNDVSGALCFIRQEFIGIKNKK